MAQTAESNRIQNVAALDVRQALAFGIARLSRAEVAADSLSAELLLLHVLGRDRSWIYAHPEHRLTSDEISAYDELLQRRISGTPTQHLTGTQEFWGIDFEVSPDVLIPRPETEHVIEVALERLRQRRAENLSSRLEIAEVGTGSGCLAVVLATELPQARIVAVDISQAALAVAARNGVRHGVAERIEFRNMHLLTDYISEPAPSFGHLTSHSDQRYFDLIVSNPPYIGRKDAAQLPREVRDHEPAEALFGGEQGSELYAPLIAQAHRLLRPGGSLVLELGYDGADHVRNLLAGRPGWDNVAITDDLAGIARVIAADRV